MAGGHVVAGSNPVAPTLKVRHTSKGCKRGEAVIGDDDRPQPAHNAASARDSDLSLVGAGTR